MWKLLYCALGVLELLVLATCVAAISHAFDKGGWVGLLWFIPAGIVVLLIRRVYRRVESRLPPGWLEPKSKRTASPPANADPPSTRSDG